MGQSSTPKMVAAEIYLLEKYTLRIEPPEKSIIKEPLGFLRPHPCTDKKWNSPIRFWVSIFNQLFIPFLLHFTVLVHFPGPRQCIELFPLEQGRFTVIELHRFCMLVYSSLFERSCH